MSSSAESAVTVSSTRSAPAEVILLSLCPTLFQSREIGLMCYPWV
ncbi:unnamed protein product [Linum tenue]|uniref:Uncharacterized protein n=1 Tax=Linum tenue TaxID=586396 RepID=A0AAV0RJ23_9ROSI|nr:unnamed protein product [Linum tenue]